MLSILPSVYAFSFGLFEPVPNGFGPILKDWGRLD